MNGAKTYEQLVAENEQLRWQLDEATETLQAIRTGQIDALVVQGADGHSLYTLKTADQTYRLFIETMNEGAVTLDKNGLILYCNSAFASMIDMPLSKVMGVLFDNLIASHSTDAFASLLHTGQLADQKLELTLNGNADRQVPCLLSMTTLPIDGDVYIILIITDLTQQKETQQLLKVNNDQLEQTNVALASSNQALNRSNHSLQQFAYVASHDLQEPLRKIQSFGDLIKTQYADQLGEGVNYLERMQVAASRMSILIKDLLAFSRLSTQQEEAIPIHLSQVIEPVLSDLELAIDESEAVIETGSLPIVQGDSSQLGQLFQNLISNALKFRQPDVPPRIQISAQLVPATDLPLSVKPIRQALAYHRIDVLDNGIGFEQKYVDRIFQVFQRLNGRSQYPGTGIGLAICEKVVANHGGAITASSQPGQGALFSVYLPE
jgi:PAS domain S-box-containing protein